VCVEVNWGEKWHGTAGRHVSTSTTSEHDDALPELFDLDTLRRELLGSLAVIDKLSNDLSHVIARLPDDPEGWAEVVMSDFTDIEEVAKYATRVFAVYAHRQLGISLARLSKGVTASGTRRRIMSDEKDGVQRPERFELDRDADAIGDIITHYEQLSRRAALHPWPAVAPLPTRRYRQMRKTPGNNPDTWELSRAEFYHRYFDGKPEAKEKYPFGEPGTPEPPAPNPLLDPHWGNVNESSSPKKK
jgi:hypothetical protein